VKKEWKIVEEIGRIMLVDRRWKKLKGPV